MEAARGAQEKVERLEAAVEEARRKLAEAERQLHAWRQGAEGELRTAHVLAGLETAGWVVLHDLHWPGRPYANIDHIAIGPTGVFVVDSKNWSGQVTVRDGVLRQNGYARSRECEGVASATAAVSAFLEPRHRSSVAAVLCLVGHTTPTTQPHLVRVVGLDHLGSSLAQGPPRLSPGEVATIGGYLRKLLDGPRSPEMKTTAALAAAGTAPREESWARRRPIHHRHPPASRPPANRPPASRRRTGRAGRSRSRPAVRELLKVIVIGVMLLVALPAVLHGVVEGVTPPVRPTPSVIHPTHSPTAVSPG